MGLDTLIDRIRINKFATFSVATGIYNLAIATAEAVTTPVIDFTDGNMLGVLNIGIGVYLIGAAVYLAKRQNHRYEGIVKGIKKHGYDKRFCSMYMNHPCGRSVIKTVLKRTGHFDKYEELKTKYPLTRLV